MIVERYREIHDVDKNKKIVADMRALSKKIINALNNNINKKVEIVKPKSKFSKIFDIIFDKPKDKLNKKTINRIHQLNKKVDGSYNKPNPPIKGKLIGLVKSVFNIFFPTPKEIKPVEIKPTGLKNLTHDRFNQLIEYNAKTIYAGGDFDLPSHRGPLFVDYNMIDEHNDSLKEETETLSEFISKYNKSEEVVYEPMFRKIHKSK